MKHIVLFLLLIQISCKKNTEVPPKSVEVVESEKQQHLIGKKEIALKGDYAIPLTNTKEALVFSNTQGNELYTWNNNTPKLLTQTQNIGNNFVWSKQGDVVFFKEKTKDFTTKFYSINPATLERKELKNYPKHTSVKALAVSDTIYFLDEKTLAVKAKYKGEEWSISSEKGNYYNLEVSPNNKYIIAHKGSNIYLFTTSGSFVKILGKGLATGWHPDSKSIIGFKDESEDGHHISSSTLLLFHIDKLTQTISLPDHKVATWPSFKNGTQIIYRDEKMNGIFSKSIKTLLE